MLEDFRLKVLVAVAARKSFTKAAEQLRISQSAVSQNVSELEKRLGVKLFERQRGETLLTDAGEIFMEYADSILEKYEDIQKMFSRFPDKVVKVSASDEVFNYIVSELLADFLKIHTEITFLNVLAGDVDLKIVLTPYNKERGMIRLSYHPSSAFASTRLWSVLSEFLEPTRE